MKFHAITEFKAPDAHPTPEIAVRRIACVLAEEIRKLYPGVTEVEASVVLLDALDNVKAAIQVQD